MKKLSIQCKQREYSFGEFEGRKDTRGRDRLDQAGLQFDQRGEITERKNKISIRCRNYCGDGTGENSLLNVLWEFGITREMNAGG
jgi:hypothetical protein